MDVIAHASVEEFFHEVVTDALETLQVDASEPTEWYLVSLLGEFTTARITDAPLGLKLAEASANPETRVRTLKEVGDTSLYVAGFFNESLGRRLVQVDYYASLGASAYGELATAMHAGSIGEVYRELAARFPSFVDVLCEVRRRVDFATPDVVKLYEQWLRTRDEWLERKLRAMGVLVDPDQRVIQ